MTLNSKNRVHIGPIAAVGRCGDRMKISEMRVSVAGQERKKNKRLFWQIQISNGSNAENGIKIVNAVRSSSVFLCISSKIFGLLCVVNAHWNWWFELEEPLTDDFDLTTRKQRI